MNKLQQQLCLYETEKMQNNIEYVTWLLTARVNSLTWVSHFLHLENNRYLKTYNLR